MAVEKLLLSEWRELPPEQQQEVVDFVEFLHNRAIAHSETEPLTPASSQLGQKLRQIRSKIVMAGEPLLQSWEDVEREVADRRGGVEAGIAE
jgi:Protein of unknown function (DUF2281)